MSASALSNTELLAVIPKLVLVERSCAADIIEHLVVVETRGLHLEQACHSLTSFCIERLGYSEDEASKRARVARLVRRFPRALEELRSGAIHLSGLALLAPYMTEQNCDELFTQARSQAKRAIERFLAARFPKPDVPERLCRIPAQSSLAVGVSPDKELPSRGGSGQELPPRPSAMSTRRWDSRCGTSAFASAQFAKPSTPSSGGSAAGMQKTF